MDILWLREFFLRYFVWNKYFGSLFTLLNLLLRHLQYYSISPTDPTISQFIHIAPPGDFAATFYAPSADVVLNGNPDLIGAIVCKTFYGNGNTSWHYDRALDIEGDPVDYRIVSYVEDIR